MPFAIPSYVNTLQPCTVLSNPEKIRGQHRKNCFCSNAVNYAREVNHVYDHRQLCLPHYVAPPELKEEVVLENKAVIDGVKLEQQNLDGIERSIVMFTVNNIIMSTFSTSIDNCVVIILF